MKKESNLSRRVFLSTGAAASGFNIKDSNEAGLPSVNEEELQASTYNSKRITSATPKNKVRNR